MLTIQDKLILKRKVHLPSGQQSTKTFKLLRCRCHTSSYQIYDIYDHELNQQLTLKMLIKTQQLSKQNSINQIKNHQLFTYIPQFISLYDIYEDTNCIYLIMQKWGTTLSQIIAVRQTMTEYQVQVIFTQLLDIIVQLRKKNIAHGCIRLESIYVDVKQSHKIKLGEFSKSFNIGKYFQSLTVDQTNNRQSTQHQIQQLSQKLLRQHHQQSQSSSNNNQKQKQPLASTNTVSVYMSPQQVKFTQQKQNDYSMFLDSLYQNDIWAVGIVIYKLLMGRFPFQVNLQQNTLNALTYGNKKKFNVGNLSIKSDTSTILTTLIKQCCYNFHLNNFNSDHFNIFQPLNAESPISTHFQQLVKSLLRPMQKRITLKQLLGHPLRLRQCDNLRAINLKCDQAPLGQCNVIISQSTKGLRKDVIERWSQKRVIRQDRLQNGSNNYQKQKMLKYLSPLAQCPLFSLYNSEQSSQMILTQVSSQESRYQYTWQLNFGQQNNPQSYNDKQRQRENRRSNKFDRIVNRVNKSIQRSKNKQYTIDSLQNHYQTNNNNNQSQSNRNGNNEKRNSNNSQNENDRRYNNIEYEDRRYNNKNNNEYENLYGSSQYNKNSSVNKQYQYQNIYNKRQPTIINNKHINNPKQNLFQSAHQQNVSKYQHYPTLSKSSSTHNFNIRNINAITKNNHPNNKNINANTHKNIITTNKNQLHTHQLSQQNHINTLQTYPQKPSDNGFKINQNDFINENHKQENLIKNKKQQKKTHNKKQTLFELNQNQRQPKQQQSQQLLNYQYQQLTQAQNIILKSYLQPIPLLVQQPQFILQYKFDKQSKSLGYVLNNAVGVIFSKGKHIMGHNQTDFVMLSNNYRLTQSNHNQQTPQSSQLTYKNNVKTYTQSTNLLSPYEQSIYHNFLKLFGKRIVISSFSLYVIKFYHQGKIFIFFINNGSWQVSFEAKKTSKFFLIDQNQLIWVKGKHLHKPQILSKARKIIQQKKNHIMKEKYYF